MPAGINKKSRTTEHFARRHGFSLYLKPVRSRAQAQRKGANLLRHLLCNRNIRGAELHGLSRNFLAACAECSGRSHDSGNDDCALNTLHGLLSS